MSGARIALIGNCQVQTLSLAAEMMLDRPSIRVLDYSNPDTRNEGVRKAFADSLEDCDFIFAQTALLSHTSEKDLAARYGDKLVTIANFYFRGLFPDSCYVGDFDNRLQAPTAVHSLVVLDAFRRGLDEAGAVASFNVDTFERLGLFDAWASSMHEMGLREANNVIAVPGGALMEDACRRYPAFLTMNHPAATLLVEYLSRVFRHAGLAHTRPDMTRFVDPLALHDLTPVPDLVAEYYDLPYRTGQYYRLNSLQFGFLSLPDYAAHCYAAYRAAAPGSLLCHSPADLRPRLQSDPALAYLVDPAATVPVALSAAHSPAGAAAPPPNPLAHVIGLALKQHLHPVTSSLDELKLFTHKIHSFAEIADPKIERLYQAAGQPDPAPATPGHVASPPVALPAAMPPPAQAPARLPAGVYAALCASALAGALLGALL